MILDAEAWESLIKDIIRERCILILGDQLATITEADSSLTPISQKLANYLATRLEEYEISYDAQRKNELHYMGLRYLSKEEFRPLDLEDEVLEFYENNVKEVPNAYFKLAELPISLVINASPEHFMLEGFRKAGQHNARLMHYNYQRDKHQEVGDISIKTPLVYNLFGSIEDPESLMLTEGQRDTAIPNSIASDNPPIPTRILDRFDSRKTYLLLGLNLSKWLLRPMFKKFKLEAKNRVFCVGRHQQNIEEFFGQEYHFDFVDQDPYKFIDALVAKYIEATTSAVEAKKVFVSFDDKDESYAIELSKRLAPLVQSGHIKLWYKNEELLEFGQDMDEAIHQNLQEADIVLNVLSPDFLVSGTINERELKITMDRATSGGLRVYSVLVRDCMYQYHPLGRMPIYPLDTDKQPVAVANTYWGNVDKAYQTAIEGLSQEFTKLVL